MLPRHLSVGSLTWVALLASTGCDRVFQLLEVGDSAPDALEADADNADAAPDGTSGPCFFDDFAAPFIDETKWTIEDAAPVAAASQQSGVLVISLGQADDVHYAQITTPLRDLTNDAFSVEVVKAASAATDAEAGIGIQIDFQHRYQFFITGSSLVMRYSLPDGNSDTFTPYSTVAHRFIRLRHAGSSMLWETSADGSLWVLRRMTTAAVDVTSVYARVFAGTYQAEPVAPGEAMFDNALIECQP